MTKRAALVLGLAACGGNAPPPGEPLLVYSRTLGFRHDSIETGIATLRAELAGDFAVEATEDPAAFTSENLARFPAVVFLHTTGDVLDPAGEAALEAFVRGGGGWLGIHAAADTEYESAFYRELVIAHFASHPAIQPATVLVEDAAHPAMAAVPAGPWAASDEWYNFDVNPRGDGVQVLATIDEASYEGGTMGDDHPLIWAHERLGGRVLYSGPGHVAERWSEPAYLAHVLGAVRWVARRD